MPVNKLTVQQSMNNPAIKEAYMLRRNGASDEQIVAHLRGKGFSDQQIGDATGIGPMFGEESDPGLDAPEIGEDGPDSFGVMQDDQADDETSPWDQSPWSTDEENEQPPATTVRQAVEQELDPLGTKAQAVADTTNPSPRIGITPSDPGALIRLLDQKKGADVPAVVAPIVENAANASTMKGEAVPSSVFSRIVDSMTGGSYTGGEDIDKMSKENPDPSIWDKVKGVAGKIAGGVKDTVGAIAPSDAAAQGLMAAGLGMLGAQGTYGDTMSALGQGGLQGIKTYQGAKRREDIAKAKADELKSLEKRADANIRMKERELAAKERESDSKVGTAREKAMLSKLARLQSMAAQGNEKEAREIFANDPELQQYLHRKDLAFERGPTWLRSGSGDDPTEGKILGAIMDKIVKGIPLNDHELMIYGQQGKAMDPYRLAAIREVGAMRAANPLSFNPLMKDHIDFQTEVDRIEKDLRAKGYGQMGYAIEGEQPSGDVDADITVPGAPGGKGGSTPKSFVGKLKERAAGGN